MSIFSFIQSEQEAELLEQLLLKALATNNNDVIDFARSEILPKYREYGEGVDPVELNTNLIAKFVA